MTDTRTLTPEEIAELRRIAEAATPGPWMADRCAVDGDGIHIYDEGGHTAEDAAHIAAFNPATALRLLDRLAEVERERDEAKRIIAGMDVERERAAETARRAEQYQRERDEAREKLADAKDALRLVRAGAEATSREATRTEKENGKLREKLAAAEAERDKYHGMYLTVERFRSEDAASHLDEQAFQFRLRKQAESRCAALEARVMKAARLMTQDQLRQFNTDAPATPPAKGDE